MERGKLPCPIDENGLPLIPEGISECYEECYFDDDERDTNRHHLAHPRAEHRGSIQRAYRETGSMVIRACLCKHSDYHATYRPPHKPPKSTMLAVMRGELEPQEAQVFIRSRAM